MGSCFHVWHLRSVVKRAWEPSSDYDGKKYNINLLTRYRNGLLQYLVRSIMDIHASNEQYHSRPQQTGEYLGIGVRA
jgi:hypothetical protein